MSLKPCFKHRILKRQDFRRRYETDISLKEQSLLHCEGWISDVCVLVLLILTLVSSMVTLGHADSTEPASSTIQQAPIQQQPDSLTDYIKQSIAQDDKVSPLPPTSNLQTNSQLTGEYNEAYYQLRALNAGLPPLDPPANLQTPLATLEFFNTAMLNGDFALGAYALNLNSIEPSKQVSSAIELSKKLDFLLTEKSLYVFDELPDRSDGLIEPPMGSTSPIKGIARRSIKLGGIDYKSRRVPIYLERVHVDGSAPVWVFSSQTVSNIDILYNVYRPAGFESYFPDWLTKKFAGMSVWEGLALLLFMVITIGISYLLSKGVTMVIPKLTNRSNSQVDNNKLSLPDKGIADLFSKITVPFTITMSFGLMFALVSGSIPKVQSIATSTRPVIWICFVFSALWLGIRTINFFANRYEDLQIDSLDEEEFKKQRVRRTYLSVFRRLFIFITVLGGIWVSLAEFVDLEGLGTTLITSAGVAGVVIGIAAQPTLGNIIAGFQVAITQPVRIGDTIMLNGVWSEVEDLRYTYAVLKTWDDRRLIVPMKYFVTEVLENWSHTNTKQSSAVYLYVDYGADIDAINKKFIEVVKAHKLWDQESEPNLLVNSVTEDSIKLRCKVSSNSPSNAWQLECEVRKLMIEYLTENQAKHLPTERITLVPRNH